MPDIATLNLVINMNSDLEYTMINPTITANYLSLSHTPWQRMDQASLSLSLSLSLSMYITDST